MKNEIYTRSQDLIQRYLKFIKTVREGNESQYITIERLLELKAVLANIHNVLTLIATLAATKKITDSLGYNEQEKKKFIEKIEEKKANSNGFDIEIEDSTGMNILVEVKCNMLIHGKKLGAQQMKGILNDVRKLRNEFPDENGKKITIDTSKYIKLIVIVDTFHEKLNNVIETIKKEVKHKAPTKTDWKHQMTMKKYIKTLDSWSSLKKLTDFENVYLATISIEEMEEVLNSLTREGNIMDC
ncbi:MAG TPA: hypothetical protein K8V05_08695 [Butyricimonas virosa]|uniref:Uncharacterized protein n=1 Tax=Butyricimonas virosa TaxID=544645 RepID=A0A921H5I0_9BACT|nr:hypothetical protein [Butyricimonas virosa]